MGMPPTTDEILKNIYSQTDSDVNPNKEERMLRIPYKDLIALIKNRELLQSVAYSLYIETRCFENNHFHEGLIEDIDTLCEFSGLKLAWTLPERIEKK